MGKHRAHGKSPRPGRQWVGEQWTGAARGIDAPDPGRGDLVEPGRDAPSDLTSQQREPRMRERAPQGPADDMRLASLDGRRSVADR